jgi:anti-sigma factor (TIGR02949 family)
LPTCKDFLRELSDYLDEQLDPETKVELDQHVKECPNCWVVLDTTQKTVKIYKNCEAQEVPQGLQSRLMSALQEKMKARREGAE